MEIRFKNGGGFSIGLIGMMFVSGVVFNICQVFISNKK